MKPFRQMLLLVVLGLPAWVQAGMFYDGADLKHLLDMDAKLGREPASPLDAVKVGRLQGFITGVNDALSGSEFCPPQEATLGDLISVVREFVDLNMERWQEPAVVLAAEALKDAYPCRKKSKE